MSLTFHIAPKTELARVAKHHADIPFALCAEAPHAMLRLTMAMINSSPSLLSIQFSREGFAHAPTQTHPYLHNIAQQIHEFLAGTRTAFEAHITLPDNPFRARAWRALAAVPYGHTISYSTLAAEAGNPNAIRAAATACATNPVPLLIPCHRIIAKDGGLGGFLWGLDHKHALLSLEHNHLTKSRVA